MDKKCLIKIIIIVLVCTLLSTLTIVFYNKWEKKNTKAFVELASNLNINVYSNISLKDLVKNINGTIKKDQKIDTTKLGKQEIKFQYTNYNNVKLNYKFSINVIDKEKPLIAQINNYTIPQGYDKDLAEALFCGDNYDDNPTCKIEGHYNVDIPGVYQVRLVGEDSSKNRSVKRFDLRVKAPSTNKKTINNKYVPVKRASIDIKDIIEEHKTDKTSIGIDVSHWQGNIDFQKVKDSGIEFVFIRVGSEDRDGNYFLDKKFKQNIEGFNKVNIPVGIYYYSYADSIERAKKEAKWVISQIKKYKVDLPVAFDWENFNNFGAYNKSFYHLTQIATSFLDEIEKAGYEGMLYSSKSKLEEIWYETKYDVWLAHYTKQTTYNGKYKVWQRCDNGYVPGIEDNLVDINIMYD